MAIKKLHASYETLDGSVHGPIRIFAADRIAAEKTASKRGWPWKDDPTTHSLMIFYAAKRAGLTSAEDYPAFMGELVDFEMEVDDDQEAGEDPTEADTESSS